MMEFDIEMLCSRAVLAVLGQFDCASIVFVHAALYFAFLVGDVDAFGLHFFE